MERGVRSAFRWGRPGLFLTLKAYISVLNLRWQLQEASRENTAMLCGCIPDQFQRSDGMQGKTCLEWLVLVQSWQDKGVSKHLKDQASRCFNAAPQAGQCLCLDSKEEINTLIFMKTKSFKVHVCSNTNLLVFITVWSTHCVSLSVHIFLWSC